MKTFTELNEEKLAKLFTEFKTSPQLVGYVTNGVPVGIASYLQSLMNDSGEEEVSLELKNKSGSVMTFKLTAVKKGDSVAFVPSFELGEVGQEYIDSDDVNFDSDAIDSMGLELIKNDGFIKAVRQAFMGKIYSDGEWIEDSDRSYSSETRGLVFDDESDIAACIASVIYTVIETLCKYKDVSSDVEYEVPGLGKFKVSPSKGGYTVTLTIDKGFKSNCKSDKLAEKIANNG